MSYRSKRRWQELDLLCRAGAGLGPIAPAVCGILRELLRAEAVLLFWLDEEGLPAGLFHESTPDCAAQLFGEGYERFFANPFEDGVSFSLEKDRPASVLMNPRRDYFCAKTFSLLMKAGEHLAKLNMKVLVENRPRAVVVLFRKRRKPFTHADEAYLMEAQPHLQRAIESQLPDGRWERSNLPGHMLVDPTGSRLFAMSGEAPRLLEACAIIGQDIRRSGSTTLPPRFAQELCRRLETSTTAEDVLDIPLGRLRLIATPMNGTSAGAEDRILISLAMELPRRLRTIQDILGLSLSPLQRSIALFAAEGGSRADYLDTTGISKEAMKKHLKAIYRALSVNSWEGLVKVLQ
ncbi:hypothetical protein [Rhizobium sp. BK251]|uniref:hypothetical protein n=1 Tax=Rhizobium sp. BK251 TaxID=2512125 RepID=UPI001046B344|nr:hypothetical protein [Rhizobium sp. BK251]TCL71080.1 hypothetical protein EV286_10653 [Rhizobium sp. BK251]